MPFANDLEPAVQAMQANECFLQPSAWCFRTLRLLPVSSLLRIPSVGKKNVKRCSKIMSATHVIVVQDILMVIGMFSKLKLQIRNKAVHECLRVSVDQIFNLELQSIEKSS